MLRSKIKLLEAEVLYPHYANMSTFRIDANWVHEAEKRYRFGVLMRL